MRDILVEQARRKAALKHGGGGRRVELTEGLAIIEPPADDLLALDEAIQQLQAEKPHLAEIAMLRYFTGLSVDETAAVLGDLGEHPDARVALRARLAGPPTGRRRRCRMRGEGRPMTEPSRRPRAGRLFDQAVDAAPGAACGVPGRRLRRRPRPPRRGGEPAGLRRGLRRGGGDEGLLKSPLVRADADDAGPTSRRPRRGARACRAGRPLPRPAPASAKAAWAPSTRPSRTTRAAPSPSRSIRPGLASPALLKRFAHEAQILGRLHHPGIAQVYEAGLADDGQPFFAMEFIRGLPLDEYARPPRPRPRPPALDLLARVCDAVQHAHDQGVIHRDLKPANILVEETGQPKVLDFGVARATDADLLTAAGLTRTGQLLGTPSYMSPEQVTADPAAIDHRADVYALGVILFELLAHRLPYRLENRPLAEAARLILEQDPPRLGSIDPELRGDVETIVAKALEKDPARRYASAADLAADLRRWLADEPILARPPSALYHLRKFARRHKGLVGGVLAGVVAGPGSLGDSSPSRSCFAVGPSGTPGWRSTRSARRSSRRTAPGWPPRSRRCRRTTWPTPRASSTRPRRTCAAGNGGTCTAGSTTAPR